MAQSRRAFLKRIAGTTVLSAAGPAWAPLFAETPVESLYTTPRGWAEQPMRWAQLAFVEDDPGRYDRAFWLDYFERIHADAACLSAGGVVAFYPTDVPLHYRSKWLGTGDSFGELSAGCRSLGMKVLARTDPHACHQDIYEARPDRISEDEHGHKRRHAADSSLWLACVWGGYSFEFMTAVHVEIMQRCRPDGIFTNRWQGIGMCFCQSCRSTFRRYSGGLELPLTQDPARRAYMLWTQTVLLA